MKQKYSEKPSNNRNYSCGGVTVTSESHIQQCQSSTSFGWVDLDHLKDIQDTELNFALFDMVQKDTGKKVSIVKANPMVCVLFYQFMVKRCEDRTDSCIIYTYYFIHKHATLTLLNDLTCITV